MIKLFGSWLVASLLGEFKAAAFTAVMVTNSNYASYPTGGADPQ